MAKIKKSRRTTKSKSQQITRWQPGAPSVKMPRKLIGDIRTLIDRSRQAVALTVNTALVWLYWNIGQRIRVDLLKQKRADYGEQIVQTLSAQFLAEPASIDCSES